MLVKRVKIDENGLKIAKSGVDVDTAGEEDLDFSSLGATQARFMAGTVSLGTATGLGTFLNDAYRMGTVNFGVTLDQAPFVYVNCLEATGQYHLPLICNHAYASDFDTAIHEPDIWFRVTTTQLIIYCRRASVGGPGLTTANYQILENLVE